MNYHYAHYKTLRNDIATFHRDSPQAQAARAEHDRRKKRDAKARKPKIRKKRVCPTRYYAAYKRKYGMNIEEVAEFLNTSKEHVHHLECSGILVHRIRLAKMRTK